MLIVCVLFAVLHFCNRIFFSCLRRILSTYERHLSTFPLIILLFVVLRFFNLFFFVPAAHAIHLRTRSEGVPWLLFVHSSQCYTFAIKIFFVPAAHLIHLRTTSEHLSLDYFAFRSVAAFQSIFFRACGACYSFAN